MISSAACQASDCRWWSGSAWSAGSCGPWSTDYARSCWRRQSCMPMRRRWATLIPGSARPASLPVRVLKYGRQPIVVFNYCPTRVGRHAAAFLGSWKGALMVDRYGGVADRLTTQSDENKGTPADVYADPRDSQSHEPEDRRNHLRRRLRLGRIPVRSLGIHAPRRPFGF